MTAKDRDPARRVGAPRTLAAMLPRVTRALAVRRGFAEADLIAHWVEIVGPEIGRRSQPGRLRFPNPRERLEGTLTLKVHGGWAVELQHMEPQVLERINLFLGYRAVSRLKIRQAASLSEPAPERTPERPLDPATTANVERRVADIADPELRARLAGLGRALARARTRRR